VNRAMEGGPLSSLLAERKPEPVTPADEPYKSPIRVLAIERLRVGWCIDCLSYEVELHGDGRVDFTGYSGTDLLGPHCGTLDAKYVEAIFGVAERANLDELADYYSKPAMDAGGRVIVLLKRLATEKLVAADGASKPSVLVDLSVLLELASTQVRWGECSAGANP
jgi:uncharacterized protein DUF6438